MPLEIRCRYCDEEIRFIDGAWLDRETFSVCETEPGLSLKHEPPVQTLDEPQALAAVDPHVPVRESRPRASEDLSAAKAEEDAPAPPRYHEESLALRILQEQKDLEAHTRAVTDVDRLVQIRDTLLKEPQP